MCGKRRSRRRCGRSMISWLFRWFPDPSPAPSSNTRLCLTQLHYPHNLTADVQDCTAGHVVPPSKYFLSNCCMCGTVGRYNSHYTFSRENMRWRHPTTPPHHQTLCSKRLEIFFWCVHSFIYHSLVRNSLGGNKDKAQGLVTGCFFFSREVTDICEDVREGYVVDRWTDALAQPLLSCFLQCRFLSRC